MADQHRIRKEPGTKTVGYAYASSEDDFLCLRFNVTYSSLDCAFRTKFKTCGGCLNCDQGRFNFRRHAATLIGVQPPRVRIMPEGSE